VLKVLERARRGMDCIMVSPDWPHFLKSLWPTFREWCPWDLVVPKHQKYRLEENLPGRSGTLVFQNKAQIHYGGIHDATSWFGGNVSFCLFDEASRSNDDAAMKSLISRARILGPRGEPPQVSCTTTPDMNWLYTYFGGVEVRDTSMVDDDDPYRAFKENSLVVVLKTMENLDNLDPDYVERHRRTLTEDEFALFMEAQWIAIADAEKFVRLVWWDNCKMDLPTLTGRETMVLGVDAAKGSEQSIADCFSVVGVTRQPGNVRDVAVRYAGIWQAPRGKLLEFAEIEKEIRRLCREFAVVEIAYDPYQLHDMMSRLQGEGIVYTREFNQNAPRLIADKQLQDLIISKRLAHDGNPLLRSHIDNANVRKVRDEQHDVKLRLVKRAPSLKIDSAVALSMACNRALFYNPIYA